MLGSKTNKYTLISLLALIVFSIYGVVQLQIQENLNDSIPGSEKLENLLPFLEEGKKTIVFSIKSDDPFDIGKLDSTATNLKVELLESFKSELDTIQFKSDIDPTAFIEFIQDKPYLYLEAADYVSIEKSIDSASMFNSMEANKADLRNPQKFGSAQSILADPLHFSSLAFKNIDQQLGLGDLMNTQGFFLSEENTKLTLHSSLLIDPSDIEASKKLANNLETFTQQWNENHSGLKLDFFGTFLIAQENAKQIKKDIILTLNIALLFIMGLLFFYYRKLSTIFFFVLPGLFGIGLALAMVWLINGQISALALSASAVILGIVVDYSFHYFSHLSVESDPFKTRNQIATPLAISSITTVLAFFSLLFAQSSALQDFGLFTGLSLLFTLVFILLFLPTLLALLQKKPNKNQSSKLNNLIQRLDKNQSKSPKLITLFSLGLTLVLFYFSFSIQFEDDLNQLNYYPEYLQQKELAHQNINPKIEKRITLVSSGSQIEEAVNNDSKLWDLIDSLGSSSDYNSIAPLLISEKEAQQKVELWNTFWNTKDAEVISNFNTAAVANGFRPEVFTSFKDKIGTRQKPLSNYNFILQFASLKKLILQDENTNVISSLKVNKSELESTKKAISSLSYVYIIDGSSIAQSMVDAVKNDFNFLLLVASSMVFITMLLFYGRIELTIISFLPMVLSWIWILGIAAVFGIKFNFINIMIATIIFGLGDDFAIFITDGLQHKLKYKTPVLSTYKAGILLSSISTIVGTGVLIFALHPAIKSIAPISVIGILTIVALSFIIQPLLFNKLILNRTEKGLPPYSFVELFMSVYAFSLFFVGSLLTTCINALIILIPFWKKDSKKLIVHHMIRATTWILINSMVFLKKRYYDYKNLDFSNPSVLLANHTSFLDILIIAQLHPKIIMMVGPWVYNSPIFGWFIRYADYIPAFTSVEENLPTIEDAVSRGYSILIFPEGHRSVDGKLRRFHKGAFFISEKLKLDITPILLHGLQ
jgi:1-acyl-sn-glycerol-3-phosphate acyltransferase